jgi:hypothetical protein
MDYMTKAGCDIRASVEAAPIAAVRAYVENNGLAEEAGAQLTDAGAVNAMVAYLVLGLEDGACDLDDALAFFAPGGEGFDVPAEG